MAAKKKTAKKKSTAKSTAKKKKASAAKTYGGMVAEIIDSRSRKSAFKPKKKLSLSIVRRRQPTSVTHLSREEREQLTAVWSNELANALLQEEYSIEVAEVVDGKGAVVYRLYGWNYGVGYLFPPKGLEVVGFGSQHDIEHWTLDQRDVFFAMDQALRKKKHGFEQPLSFCWWDDECWDELTREKPGTVQSEPPIRKQLMRSRELTS